MSAQIVAVIETNLTPLTCNNTPNGTGVTPFADQAMRDSIQVWVDGNLIHVQDQVVVYKPKINAQVVIGNDHGYSGMVFGETGDGGSVVLSLCRWQGNTLVGVIRQNRQNQWPFQGILNAVAGMVPQGSNHFQAAKAEASQERGDANGLMGELICLDDVLGAAHGNSNSTFWQTLTENGGIHYYLQIVSFDALEPSPNDGDGFYQFRPGVVTLDVEHLEPDEVGTMNKILKSVFLDIDMATIMCGDAKTRAAIALLNTWLRKNPA